MGFKEESASQGELNQKQGKVFDKISFSRAGLTKVLMPVSFKETKNARFQKLVLDPFWFWIVFSQVGFGFQALQLSFFCGSNR